MDKQLLQEGMLHIKLWQYSKSSCFGVKLIELIAKADTDNRQKLSMGFPQYVQAYKIWFTKEYDGHIFKNDKELFEYFNV